MHRDTNKNIGINLKTVQNVLSYKRFTEINTNISFNSIDKSPAEEKRNIQESIEKIITSANDLFNDTYSPSEHLLIDEGMGKFQGKYSFKTYMPEKPINPFTFSNKIKKIEIY
jgi:hypothetical protein